MLDFFFDGGWYVCQDVLLWQVEQMLKEGVVILDIGGMFFCLGVEIILVEEELQWVLLLIEVLYQVFLEVIFSIDIICGWVVEEVVGVGVVIVNDIFVGVFDELMYLIVACLQVFYIFMYMKGSLKIMQDNLDYEDVVQMVLDFFIVEVGKLWAFDVYDIVLDFGFGFGKIVEYNYQLFK